MLTSLTEELGENTVYSLLQLNYCIFHIFLLFFFSFSQTSDGIPIHLKRGVPDRLLYRTTMALTVGGALYCLVALYFAAQPSNK